jgi:8-oxo-dGTP pyrophosphatase MutT (NUDIX family)
MGPDPLNNPADDPYREATNADPYVPEPYRESFNADPYVPESSATPRAAPLQVLKRDAARRKPVPIRAAQPAKQPLKIVLPKWAKGYTLDKPATPSPIKTFTGTTAPASEAKATETATPAGRPDQNYIFTPGQKEMLRPGLDYLTTLAKNFGIPTTGAEFEAAAKEIGKHPFLTFPPVALAKALYAGAEKSGTEETEALAALMTRGTSASQKVQSYLSHEVSADPIGGLKDKAIDDYLNAGGEPVSPTEDFTHPKKYLRNLNIAATNPKVLADVTAGAIQGALVLDGYKSLGNAFAGRVAARGEILPPELPPERALSAPAEPQTIEGRLSAPRAALPAPPELTPSEQEVHNVIEDRVSQHPQTEMQVRSDLEQVAPENRQAVLEAINRRGLEAYQRGDIKAAAEAVQHAHILREIMAAEAPAPVVNPPAPAAAAEAEPGAAPTVTPEPVPGTQQALFETTPEAEAKPSTTTRRARPVATAEPQQQSQMGLFGTAETEPTAPLALQEAPTSTEAAPTAQELASQIAQDMTRGEMLEELGPQGRSSDPRIRIPDLQLAMQLALKRLSTGAVTPASRKEPVVEPTAAAEQAPGLVGEVAEGLGLAKGKGTTPQPEATTPEATPTTTVTPTTSEAPETVSEPINRAADLAQQMAEMRKRKPSSIAKRFGANGPTPEQRAAHEDEVRAWNREYSRLSREQKKALEEDNKKFREEQEPVSGAAATEPEPTVTPAAAAPGAPVVAPAATGEPITVNRLSGTQWEVPGTDYHIRLVNDNFDIYKGGEHIKAAPAPELADAKAQIQAHMAASAPMQEAPSAVETVAAPKRQRQASLKEIEKSHAEARGRSRDENALQATGVQGTLHNAPVIAANDDAMVLLDRMSGLIPDDPSAAAAMQHGFSNGTAIDGAKATKIIADLRQFAEDDPEGHRGLSALADLMESHRTPNGNVVIHRSILSRARISRVALEELFHDWQYRHLIAPKKVMAINGAMLLGPSASTWRTVIENLVKDGYKYNTATIEAPAWVAAGDYNHLIGIDDPAEAMKAAVNLLADYFEQAHRILGKKAIEKLPPFAESLKEKVHDEIERRNLGQPKKDISGGDRGRVDPHKPAASGLSEELPRGTGSKRRRRGPQTELAQSRQRERDLAPVWYLKSERVIADKMKGPMPGSDVLRMLQNNGINQDELKWTGLDDYLPTAGRVTPAQVRNYIAENGIRVEEVKKGTPSQQLRLFTTGLNEPAWGRRGTQPATKYAGYQLPGGQDYRELLLTLPGKSDLRVVPSPDYSGEFDVVGKDDRIRFTGNTQAEALAYIEETKQTDKGGKFISPHWDEPNVLAHVRMNDRYAPDGSRLLHLEEIQSDWHQKGRRQGYGASPEIQQKEEIAAKAKDAYSQLDRKMISLETDLMRATIRGTPEEVNRLKAEVRFHKGARASAQDSLRRAERELEAAKASSVPEAPFKKTWQEVALRRMVRYAAEHGYDGISWTGGADQAERYDLSKQVDWVEWNGDTLTAGKGDRSEEDTPNLVQQHDVSVEKLPDLIGKEAAQKLIQKRQENPNQMAVLTGVDLKVGGEGMRGFYDQIVPSYLNKFGKKFGARVGTTNVGTGETKPQYTGPDLTPQQLEDAVAFDRLHALGMNDHDIQNIRDNARSALRTMRQGGTFGEALADSFTDWRTGEKLAELAGGKLEEGHVSKDVQYLPITDEMYESVLGEGVPMFQSRQLNRDAYKTPEREYAPEFRADETDDEARARRLRQNEWEQSTLAAMSEGKLTPEEARKNGLYGSYNFKPLPGKLYHVTTARDAVAKAGLMSRWELEQQSGLGLGGGDDKSVSFTTDLNTAKAIEQGIHMAHKVATGEITVQDMVDMANRGEGAPRPFMDEFQRALRAYTGGSDPLGFALKEEKIWQSVLSSEPKEGEGWEPDPEGGHWTGGDGVERYVRWKRPMTEEEKAKSRWDVFKAFSPAREWAGGQEDPLFFSNDVQALAKLDPNQIATLQFAPQPGAMGTQANGLEEWRTYSGRAVKLIGRGRPSEDEPLEKLKAEMKARQPIPAPDIPESARRPIKTFVSPNVFNLENLSEAQMRLGSMPQKLMQRESDWLLNELGSQVKSRSATGIWEDGAENTLMHEFPADTDHDLVTYHNAILAKAGWQKAMLNFFPHTEGNKEGNDVLFRLSLPKESGTSAEISKVLAQHGIEASTILNERDGHAVLIATTGKDENKTSLAVQNAVGQLGGTNGARLTTVRGRSDYVGEDDRDRAGELFTRIIDDKERLHPEWREVRQRSEQRPGFVDLQRMVRETKEPFTRVAHGSKQPEIVKVKPQFSGQGGPQRGEEIERRKLYKEWWVDRSYFQIEGTPGEPVYQKLPNQYKALFNAENLYNYYRDPSKLRDQIPEKVKRIGPGAETTYFEKLIKDNSYDGYYADAAHYKGIYDPKHGMVAAFYDTPVEKALNKGEIKLPKPTEGFTESGHWAGAGNAASGVLLVSEKTGRIGLPMRSHRVSSPSTWGTVGGAVEEGQTPEESARREVAEETGYTGPMEMIPAHVFKDGDFKYHNFIGVVPDEFPYQPSPGSAWETQRFQWHDPEELKESMQKHPDAYHPGLRELFDKSGPLIDQHTEPGDTDILQSRRRPESDPKKVRAEAEKLNPRGSTVVLMKQPLLPRYRDMWEIGDHLESYTRQTLKQLSPGDTSAEHKAMVDRAVRLARDELKYQLAQENSGVDWYKKDVRSASNSLISEMKKLHPELADPTKERMFLLFTAATSPGKTAAFENVNISEQVYDLYKRDKKVPLRQPDGKPWGTYGNAPLVTAQALLKHFDGDEAKAMEWMLTKHPIKELEDIKEKADFQRDTVKGALPPDYDPEAVYGSYILGEKVGPFNLNLNGISTELTVDIWFMRTWNRLMGTLVGPDPKGKKHLIVLDKARGKNERAAMIAAVDKLKEEFGLETSQVQAALWYYEQGLYNRLGKKGTYGGTYANAAKEVYNLRSGGFTSRSEADAYRRYDALQGTTGGGARPHPEGVRAEDTEGEGAGSTGSLFGEPSDEDISFAPEQFGEPKVIPVEEARRVAERQKPRVKKPAKKR